MTMRACAAMAAVVMLGACNTLPAWMAPANPPTKGRDGIIEGAGMAHNSVEQHDASRGVRDGSGSDARPRPPIAIDSDARLTGEGVDTVRRVPTTLTR